MVRFMRRTIIRTAFAAALVMGLAACGGDDTDSSTTTESTGSGGVNRVAVEALDSLKFDSENFAAKAGEVEFVYTNGGSIQHTLLVDGIDADEFKLTVNGKGDTDDGAVDLEAGEYTIYCDVSGHRQAGMEATLEVS